MGSAERYMREKDSMPPETREELEKIYSAGDKLLGIINDILDLPKAGTGKPESSGELKPRKKPAIKREQMPYGKVLVVDDMPSNLDIVKLLLKPYGLTVDTATSGFEAIDLIKGGNIYDIIFMDHMMPEMDGIEAAKNIRGLGYAHPVIALTANTEEGQADVFLADGFDDFVSKPVDMRTLDAVLNKYIRDKHLQ
jgi:CheY-like chemotaxis protein